MVKPLLCIVDGPDGTGKTTLIRQLAAMRDAELSFSYLPTGRGENESDQLAKAQDWQESREQSNYHKWLSRLPAFDAGNKRICYLQDRGPVSNWVYSHWRAIKFEQSATPEQKANWQSLIGSADEELLKLDEICYLVNVLLVPERTNWRAYSDERIKLTYGDSAIIAALYGHFALLNQSDIVYKPMPIAQDVANKLADFTCMLGKFDLLSA